jgi:glycosyltransferase involved in cell wall biosynthesis
MFGARQSLNTDTIENKRMKTMDLDDLRTRISRTPENRRGEIELVERSQLFDAEWYLQQYPDVRSIGMRAAEHYIWLGAHLHRNPSSDFATRSYLETNPDVANSGMNPLVHYLRHGKKEGREVHSVESSSRLPTARKSGALAEVLGPKPWLADHRKSALLDSLPDPDGSPVDLPEAATLKLADELLAGKDLPLVSIVMPTYNRAHSISKAIDSALGQSYPSIEILVVDDGSTDNTLELVRSKYAGELAAGHICLLESNHGGVCAARNVGLKAAKGDLIAYLDSDNAWRPDFLKVMCAFFAECDDAMAAYSALFSKDLESGRTQVRSVQFNRRRLIDSNFIDLNVYMHRRAVYDQLGGFDETLKRLVDWDMIVRHTRIYEPAFLNFIGVDYFLDKKGLGNITHTISLDNNRDAVLAKLRTERFRHGLEKPKFAYIVWDWPALSQSFVVAELRWLVEQGFDVEVFYKTEPDRAAELSFPIKAHKVADHQELAKLLKERGRTLVHAHFAYPSTTLLAWPACQEANIPFTFFAHAVDIFHKSNVERNRIDEIVGDPLCLKLFVHGDYHRNFLARQNVPAEKIAYNFQAVDLTVFQEVPDKPAPQVGEVVRGIFVGRFVEKKGIGHLIEAAKLLQGKPVAFDIYGYGPLEAEVKEKVADLGLSNVVFHGPLDGVDAVRGAMEKADFCIVPSVVAENGDTEGFPTVILEAMAARRPVVTTTVSSIPDFIDDGITAFLAEPANPTALAYAVNQLVAMSPERRSAMLRDAGEFLDSRIGLDRTMQTYFDTWYDNLLDIVLVTYDTADYCDREETLEIIRRLRTHTTTPFTLTVIDNGSDADFRYELQRVANDTPNMRYLPLAKNRFVGPATNLALASSDSVFTVYVCSKEGFVAKHGWERPLISYMRDNPNAAMAGSLCHLPRYAKGSELATHADFARFRNPDFALEQPDRPVLHVQGGLFILRRSRVSELEGFSNDLPQNFTDVEFSYFLESKGARLGVLPQISAVTVQTIPTLLAEIDEHTAIAHPLDCTSAGYLDRMQDRQTTRCNLCEAWDCLDHEGKCGTCGSTGIERKIFQSLAHDWRAHRGNGALVVGDMPRLATVLGERMFKVTHIASMVMAANSIAPASGCRLICLAEAAGASELKKLLLGLEQDGLLVMPESRDALSAELVQPEGAKVRMSHRNSRVLANDWRRLAMIER